MKKQSFIMTLEEGRRNNDPDLSVLVGVVQGTDQRIEVSCPKKDKSSTKGPTSADEMCPTIENANRQVPVGGSLFVDSAEEVSPGVFKAGYIKSMAKRPGEYARMLSIKVRAPRQKGEGYTNFYQAVEILDDKAVAVKNKEELINTVIKLASKDNEQAPGIKGIRGVMLRMASADPKKCMSRVIALTIGPNINKAYLNNIINDVPITGSEKPPRNASSEKFTRDQWNTCISAFQKNSFGQNGNVIIDVIGLTVARSYFGSDKDVQAALKNKDFNVEVNGQSARLGFRRSAIKFSPCKNDAGFFSLSEFRVSGGARPSVHASIGGTVVKIASPSAPQAQESSQPASQETPGVVAPQPVPTDQAQSSVAANDIPEASAVTGNNIPEAQSPVHQAVAQAQPAHAPASTEQSHANTKPAPMQQAVAQAQETSPGSVGMSNANSPMVPTVASNDPLNNITMPEFIDDFGRELKSAVATTNSTQSASTASPR